MTDQAGHRLYVALTPAGLRELAETGVISGRWPRVRAHDATEEGEYAALMSAADLSAEAVAQAADGQRRRVVVVLEKVASEESVDQPLERLAAIHLDLEDDVDPDEDLAWYAAQELSDLV